MKICWSTSLRYTPITQQAFGLTVYFKATVMVVSVTASTTQGKDLSKEELDTVANACDIAMELHESKVKIFE